MKATKTLIASAILAASIAAPAMAVEGLSANAAVTSNYLWRGMTQSGNDAAVSGGIDYADASGVYAGAWTSSLGGAGTETDFYAGYAGKAGDVEYDVGYIYYQYSNGGSDFSEIYASATYSYFTFGVATLVDSDAGGDFASDTYLNLDVAYDIGSGIELGAHIGYYDGDSFDGQVDYNISLSKDAFTLMFSDSDMDGSDAQVAVTYTFDLDL